MLKGWCENDDINYVLCLKKVTPILSAANWRKINKIQ